MKNSQPQLEEIIRRTIGNPSTTRLPPETIYEAIESARLEYSKYKPIQTLFSFPTVASQQGYNRPTGCIYIIDLYYPATVFSDWLDWLNLYPATTILHSGISIWHNPSIVEIFYSKVEAFRHHFTGDFIENDTQILLIPTPEVSDIYIGGVYAKERTLSQIPETDTNTFLLWAKAEAIESLGQAASNLLSASIAGDSITFSGGKTKISESERLKKEFKEKMGSHLGAFHWG